MEDECTTVEWVDLDLTLPPSGPRLNRKTPLETKPIRSVTIFLEDGSTLEFDFSEENISGYYRRNELLKNGTVTIQHEVYVNDGNPG